MKTMEYGKNWKVFEAGDALIVAVNLTHARKIYKYQIGEPAPNKWIKEVQSVTVGFDESDQKLWTASEYAKAVGIGYHPCRT